jgi:hypothetical protein
VEAGLNKAAVEALGLRLRWSGIHRQGFSLRLDPQTRNIRTEIDLPNPTERLIRARTHRFRWK